MKERFVRVSMLKRFLFLSLFCSANALGAQYRTIFNPFTSRMDYVNDISGNGAIAGFVLRSANSVLCSATILTTGNLQTNAVSSIPSSEIYPNQLVLKDSGGAFWTVTADNTCHLVTSAGGSYAQAVNSLFLNDSASVSWVLTVSTLGNLVTS